MLFGKTIHRLKASPYKYHKNKWLKLKYTRRQKQRSDEREREAMRKQERSKEREIEIRYTQRQKQREAMRPGTQREKQRRERGRTVKTTSIRHKKSKHDYCQFFCRHRFPRQTQNIETAGTYKRKRNLSAINFVDRRNCHRFFIPLSYIWVFNMTSFLGILVGQVQI